MNRPETKTFAYASFSSPGGGTSRMLDNVVWSCLPGGCNGGEVCCLRLNLVCRLKLIKANDLKSLLHTLSQAYDCAAYDIQ